jgi:hypothetical protein
MAVILRNGRWPALGLAVGLLLTAALVTAGERREKSKVGQYNPGNESVEMFAAIEKGQIDVKLIPKDSKESRVIIENKTDKPLNVQLPSAFAGVPVLAQVGAAGVGGAGRGVGAAGGVGRAARGTGSSYGSGGSSYGNNQNQAYGGGMGGMGMGGMGMGGMGMGGGFMNVAPEKVGELKVATVCLEHGKREPRAAIPYEIKPIESFTDKPAVQELCRMLGTGQVNQRAAQAAAWNLSNNMSWQELAAKRLQHANGTSEPYFSPQEIKAGMQVVATAMKLAEQRKQQEKPTAGNSVSQN